MWSPRALYLPCWSFPCPIAGASDSQSRAKTGAPHILLGLYTDLKDSFCSFLHLGFLLHRTASLGRHPAHKYPAIPLALKLCIHSRCVDGQVKEHRVNITSAWVWIPPNWAPADGLWSLVSVVFNMGLWGMSSTIFVKIEGECEHENIHWSSAWHLANMW